MDRGRATRSSRTGFVDRQEELVAEALVNLEGLT